MARQNLGKAQRLAKVFQIDKSKAGALVAAGYDLPKKIKKAKDADLLKVKGIGGGTAAKLRRY
jgi:DNA uptake protein ComE-like DNA-binding protein